MAGVVETMSKRSGAWSVCLQGPAEFCWTQWLTGESPSRRRRLRGQAQAFLLAE